MKTIDADGHVIEPADLWERELPESAQNKVRGANAARLYALEV